MILDRSCTTSAATGWLRSAVMPPFWPPRHLSKTQIRVSKLVPCLAKAVPDTAPVKTRYEDSARRPKAPAHAGAFGAKPAP